MSDALRTLELLWGRESAARRGPSQKTSVAEIVRVAVAIADTAGLSGVTMRAIGEELGRTAMSLYTYVPGREVLIALMYDGVHAEAIAAPSGAARRRPKWRKAVMAWAADLREVYFRHPWVLEISQAQPVLGPHEQEVLERLLVILAGRGATAKDRRAVTSALFSIVRESAKRKAEAAAEFDPEWWAARGEALQAVAPDFATRFPESVALAHDQSRLGPSPWIKAAEDAFTDAITLLCDGLEPRLAAPN